MKKRTKADATAKRFYASGIPMYRERNKPLTIPAKTMVNVINVGTKTSLCEFRLPKEQAKEMGLDNVFVKIANDNFAGDKVVRPAKEAKPVKTKGTKKAKTVAEETGTPTVETAPVVATEAPVVAEETPATETAPAAEAPAVETPAAVEQPAEMAV